MCYSLFKPSEPRENPGIHGDHAMCEPVPEIARESDPQQARGTKGEGRARKNLKYSPLAPGSSPLKSGAEEIANLGSDGRVSTLDPLALGRLRELTQEADPAMLPMIFTAFLNDATKLLSGLKAAASSMNPDQLQKDAHGLKGASAEVGARCMVAICQNLEDLGRLQTVAGANEWIGQLDQEFRRVQVEIEAQLLE
jgi:HPt (histidine-containing phosphotransfer) domain-containing protein